VRDWGVVVVVVGMSVVVLLRKRYTVSSSITFGCFHTFSCRRITRGNQRFLNLSLSCHKVLLKKVQGRQVGPLSLRHGIPFDAKMVKPHSIRTNPQSKESSQRHPDKGTHIGTSLAAGCSR
jgi:hypothetical protein